MATSSSIDRSERIDLLDLEGSVLTDSDNGLAIRHSHLEPALAHGEKIIVDFSGIDVATPSWVNSFLGGAILDHGISILHRLSFAGCNDAVKECIRMVVSISAAEAQTDRAMRGVRKTDGWSVHT